MKRSHLLLVFAVAAGLFLPAVRYGFVQDDLALVVNNPAAHSLPAALGAWDDPYWPRQTGAGLYRPVTVTTLALDWAIGGGKPGWFHVMNALWHGLAAVLVTLLFARWLPVAGAVTAGLVFAVHPVHVEGVASIVARAELLAAAAMFGAVLLARRGGFAAAVLAAAVSMFSKEHGVITVLLILADDLLNRDKTKSYPRLMYAALSVVTAAFLIIWWQIGRAGANDIAVTFYGTTVVERLATSFPAIARAATLLVWPADLSADYGPQVLPVRTGFSFAAVIGLAVVALVVWLIVSSWRARPWLAFATITAVLAYLPTSNLLFASGIVLAERNLYVSVVLPAVLVGAGALWVGARWGTPRAGIAVGLVVVVLGMRSLLRLPAWENNRRFLLTTLTEHPESYRAHVWAAAVFSGMGDSAGARREYSRAEALFDRDPHLDAAHGLYLMTLGDTTAAAPRIARARAALPRQLVATRAQVLLFLARGDSAAAKRLVDSARAW